MALLLGMALGSSPQLSQEPYLVGGNISRPKRVKFVEPVFPPEAEASGVQSLVIVELTVDREGKVVEVKPLRGAAQVIPSAVEAARQWIYEPTLVDGKPVSLRFAETVLFVLRKPPRPDTPSPGFFGGNGMFLRPPAPEATASAYKEWTVVGEAFTCCPCNTPCPCRSNAPPSHPPCEATTAQHFFEGHYGDVDLSGVTFVSVGPEHWTAVYFDEQMSLGQRQAILDIFASMSPGAPQVYLTARPVPIAYEVTSDRSSKRVVIPGILEMASRVEVGEGGRLLETVAGQDVWANELAYGQTGVYRFGDAEIGKSWNHSGRQSNHKQFVTTKSAYDGRLMLIQHGDGSGRWTPGQRKLLSCAAR
jgi:hypothetical protein